MEDIVKQLAKKYNKSEETIRNIVRHPTLFMRRKIEQEPGARFLFHNLGTFEPQLWIVNRYIRKLLRDYRTKRIDREEANKEIAKSWKIRNRILRGLTKTHK